MLGFYRPLVSSLSLSLSLYIYLSLSHSLSISLYPSLSLYLSVLALNQCWTACSSFQHTALGATYTATPNNNTPVQFALMLVRARNLFFGTTGDIFDGCSADLRLYIYIYIYIMLVYRPLVSAGKLSLSLSLSLYLSLPARRMSTHPSLRWVLSANIDAP